MDPAIRMCAHRYGQNLSNLVLPNYPFSDYKSPFWLDAEIVGDR